MLALPRGLAPRLILALTIFVAIVEAVFGYINLHAQERQLLDEMIMGADQLSRSITSATWHTMLANQPDAPNPWGSASDLDAHRHRTTRARRTGGADPVPRQGSSLLASGRSSARC